MGLWLFVCLWVCYHDNSKLHASILSKLGGSDRLQLIKFWPSRAPGNGVCGGAKIFGSALLQCLCLSERFFIFLVFLFMTTADVADDLLL